MTTDGLAPGVIEQALDAASNSCTHVMAAAAMALGRTRFMPGELDQAMRAFSDAVAGRAPVGEMARALLSNKRTKKHLREAADILLQPDNCRSCERFRHEFLISQKSRAPG